MPLEKARNAHALSAQELEREADRLLRQLPRDPQCPTYTEAQLRRYRQTHHVMRLDSLAESMEATRPSQSFLDELHFLAAITPLNRRERICLRGWLHGWTQREIGQIWWRALDRTSQQTVSRLLRSALRKLLSARGLTFDQFSRRTIYRRPARPRNWRSVVCPFCSEVFAYGLGDGRYCSTACREQSTRRSRARRTI